MRYLFIKQIHDCRLIWDCLHRHIRSLLMN